MLLERANKGCAGRIGQPRLSGRGDDLLTEVNSLRKLGRGVANPLHLQGERRPGSVVANDAAIQLVGPAADGEDDGERRCGRTKHRISQRGQLLATVS